MPVLARTFEEAGLSTIIITPMPFWAERVGVPRTLAVEFPFGQVLGAAGDAPQQHRVVGAALNLLETAQDPGTVAHWPEKWSQPCEQARKAWQPAEPSPIVVQMAPHVLQMIRQRKPRG